jgi:hypothetical protein
MATQYTSILKLALPTQGELSGTWGDVVNDNITSMVEEAIAGRSVINSWAANSHTLTTADGLTSESRAAMLEFTDTGTALSGAATVICPTATKIYVCKNGAGQTVTVKTAAGTGVAIPNGETMFVFCDGTNVVQAVTSLTTLKVGTGIQVSTILDEDNMASDSATALATQQSIKAYVDAQITAQDLDFAGDTGTGAVDLDSQTFTVAGTANEIETSASGQTITIGLPTAIVVTTITTTNVQATNIKANDGTAAITIADSTGQVTVTDAVLTTADINGGTADNVTIGGSTAAAGSFTTLGASGTTTLSGALALTGNLDINTNKFNVTAVDGNTLIAGTLGVTGVLTANAGVVVDNFTLDGTTLALSSGEMTLDSVAGDIVLDAHGNQIAFKGDSGQIGFIDLATGRMDIKASNADADMRFQGNDGGVAITALTLDMSEAGAATFNSTIALGDSKQIFFGADSDGRISFDGTDTLNITASNGSATTVNVTANNFKIGGASRLISGTANDSVVINEDSADVDFRVESNDNTNMLFVDGGNNRVGIGTGSPSAGLELNLATGDGLLINSADVGTIKMKATPGGVNNWGFATTNLAAGDFGIYASNSVGGDPISAGAAKLYFTSTGDATFSGNVTVPNQILHAGDTDTYMQFHAAEEWRVVAGGYERFAIGPHVVVNEDSHDSDFRVESDGNANMLFVDASVDRVGVGATPMTNGSTFQVTSDSTESTNMQLTLRGASDTNKQMIMGFDTTANTAHITTQIAGSAPTPLIFKTGNVVFNEASSDSDFRVESNDNENMLFVDGGNNRVGIGKAAASQPFEVGVFSAFDTGMTINETGADSDFRVESDTQTHALFVDASQNKVVFGGSASPAINVGSTRTYDAVATTGIALGSALFTHGYIGNNGVAGDVYIASNAYPANVGSSRSIRFAGGTAGGGYNDNIVTITPDSGTVFNEDSTDLDFRVESDLNTHALFVDGGNNKVVLGNSTTSASVLGVYGDASSTFLSHFQSATAGDLNNAAIYISKTDSDTTASQAYIAFVTGGAASGEIVANGTNQAAFGAWSDRRLKENIEDLPSQLGNITSLRPVEFDYRDGSGHQIGFIAQELQEVFPDAVSENSDTGMLKVAGWTKNEAIFVKAIQEQQELIKTLEARITALENT